MAHAISEQQARHICLDLHLRPDELACADPADWPEAKRVKQGARTWALVPRWRVAQRAAAKVVA